MIWLPIRKKFNGGDNLKNEDDRNNQDDLKNEDNLKLQKASFKRLRWPEVSQPWLCSFFYFEPFPNASLKIVWHKDMFCRNKIIVQPTNVS